MNIAPCRHCVNVPTPSGGAPAFESSSKVPSEYFTSLITGPTAESVLKGQNSLVSRSFTSTLSTLRKKRNKTYQHRGMTRTCTLQ